MTAREPSRKDAEKCRYISAVTCGGQTAWFEGKRHQFSTKQANREAGQDGRGCVLCATGRRACGNREAQARATVLGLRQAVCGSRRRCGMRTSRRRSRFYAAKLSRLLESRCDCLSPPGPHRRSRMIEDIRAWQRRKQCLPCHGQPRIGDASPFAAIGSRVEGNQPRPQDSTADRRAHPRFRAVTAHRRDRTWPLALSRLPTLRCWCSKRDSASGKRSAWRGRTWYLILWLVRASATSASGTARARTQGESIPLTDKAAQMLRNRQQTASGELVFANREGRRYLVTSINHLHQKARALVGLGKDFVIHSLRHTMLTRLGESERGCLHDHEDCGT